MTLKKSLFAALVAIVALEMTASDSFAWFGRHRGGSCGSWGGGSWGSRGSWGGSWGGGSWGGGSWGGGSWGGGSWGGGSWGGYSSCGSYGGGYAYDSYGHGSYVSVSRPAVTVVAKATPAVRTQLTLQVPADAKVTLAGVETKQTGEVRQFATSKLASGQVWDNYLVVVELQRDGRTVREERTIKLTGGQDQALAVNFDADSNQQIAQR